MTAGVNLSHKPYDKMSTISSDILYNQSLSLLPLSIDELAVMLHDESESLEN